jgi:hypothetical protein
MTTTTIDLAAESRHIIAVLEAGMETRAFVLGAMEPTLATEAARDAWVQECARLSPRVAAEFLRGWVTREDAPAESFAWHRYISGVRIEVAA